jgi:hypothetical protein
LQTPIGPLTPRPSPLPQSFASPGVFVAEFAILATWLGALFLV